MNTDIPVKYTIDLTTDPLGSARAVICHGWDGCYPDQPYIVLRSVWSAKRSQYMRRMGPPDWRAVVLIPFGIAPDMKAIMAAVDSHRGGAR